MIRFDTGEIGKLGKKFMDLAEEAEPFAKQAVAKSTLQIEAGAKQRAQVKTGKLRSSIGSTFEDGGLTGKVTATAEHAAYVEFNTRPHIIRAKNARFLRFNMDGKVYFRKQVRHPGTKAQPFLRPALREEKPYFLKEMAKIGRLKK